MRVGALRSKGLLVTEALLEEVAGNGDLAKLLLSPELFEKAGGLDTAGLREISPLAKSLGIYDGVIALEEESIAEEACNDGEGGGALSLSEDSTKNLLGSSEAKSLFTAEDLSRLKLTLLTGVDPDAKREALRQISLSPLSLEEKGAVTLHVLGDSDAGVRREAVEALCRLGMDSSLSDLLSTLADEGSSRSKRLALQRIEALRDRITEPERKITLGCLVATLRFEKDGEVTGALLGTLPGFTGLLAEGNETFVSLVRWLVKAVAEDPAGLMSPARKLFLSPEMVSSPRVVEVLWRELEGIREPGLRSFFQAILCGMDLPPARKTELAARVARDLAGIPVEDLSAVRLSEGLALLGDDALRALHETLPVVDEDTLGFYLKVIDAVASMAGIDEGLVNETGKIFLTTLKSASRPVRSVIMEAKLCGHPRLSSDLKRDLCIDIVRNLHLLRSDQLVASTTAILCRMGIPVLEPLQATIRESAYPVEREVAARALLDIALSEARATEILPFFRSLEKGDLVPTGQVVRAVGKLCGDPGVKEAAVSDVYRDYSGRLRESENRFDLIAALAWIASAPGASRKMAADTALQLLRLFESDLPSPGVTRSESEEGPLFVLGEETEIYTELLPDVIGGIARMVCSGKLAPGVRAKTTRRLLEKYDAVMEYREVWAPGNVVELGEALSSIARGAGTSTEIRRAVIETLLKNARNLATARILSEVMSSVPEDSDSFAVLAEECARRLFDLFEHPAYREREDQRILVSALGRMALVPRLGSSADTDRALKTRAVEALLGEAGPGFPEGSRVLRSLSGSDHLPRELRDLIAARRGS